MVLKTLQRFLLVAILLTVPLSAQSNQRVSNTVDVTGPTFFLIDFSALSFPQIAIAFSVTTASAATESESINFVARDVTTGRVYESATLVISEGALARILVPPCEVINWGAHQLNVSINFDTTAQVTAHFEIVAESTDMFFGNVQLNTSVSRVDSLPFSNYFLTVYVPQAISSAREFTLNLDITDVTGSLVPFSFACLKVGNCLIPCDLNQVFDASASSVRLPLQLKSGTYYYANFTVAAPSQNQLSITATLTEGVEARQTTGSATAGAASILGGSSSSSSSGDSGLGGADGGDSDPSTGGASSVAVAGALVLGLAAAAILA